MRAVSDHILLHHLHLSPKITVVDVFGSVSYAFGLSIFNTFQTSPVLRTLPSYSTEMTPRRNFASRKLARHRSCDSVESPNQRSKHNRTCGLVPFTHPVVEAETPTTPSLNWNPNYRLHQIFLETSPILSRNG